MIIAIDPSLTSTAVIAGTIDGFEQRCFGSKNIGDHVEARMKRYEMQVHELCDWLDKITKDGTIEAIFIEAYSFGSNDARSKFSAEYGGILRWHLVEFSRLVYEVAPTTLKKFATGKGAEPKDMIAMHLSHRYGVLFSNNDVADAFGLFRLGLVALEHCEPANVAQAEAVAKVMGPKVKKPKKQKPEALPANPTLPF